MQEQPRNRDWVKNAAIIFLVVILVLTFFSNTIMNRTLPEVATQEVTSGSIVARVRGTGTVQANSNTQVKMDQNRVIRSVLVKVGQQVNAGDVLFTLGEGASEEIDAAEEKLQSLQASYNRTAATIPEFNYSTDSRKIGLLKDKLDAAAENLRVAEQAAKAATPYADQVAAVEAELENAVIARDKAKKEYDEARGRSEEQHVKTVEEFVNLNGADYLTFAYLDQYIRSITPNSIPPVIELDNYQIALIRLLVQNLELDGDLLNDSYENRNKMLLQIDRVNNLLDGTGYLVQFYDEDGKTLLQSTTEKYGTVPSYSGIMPTRKSSTPGNIRVFDYWENISTQERIAAVTKAVDYKAVYREEKEETTSTPEPTSSPDVSINIETLIVNTNSGNSTSANTSTTTTSTTTTPGATTPGATTPDATTPEVTTPEVTTPDATTPEVTTPDATTPGATTPEVTTPEENILGMSTLELNPIEMSTLESNLLGSIGESTLDSDSSPSTEGISVPVDATKQVVQYSEEKTSEEIEESNNDLLSIPPTSPQTGEKTRDELLDWLHSLEKALQLFDEAESWKYYKEQIVNQKKAIYDAAVAEAEKWGLALQTYLDSGTAESAVYKSKKEAYNNALDAYQTAVETYHDKKSANETTLAGYNADLANLWQQITKTKEKLEDLLGGEEAQIKAKVSGTIQTLNAAPGDTKKKDDVLATIEVPDMGYMMSFSVTNDQASRLRVGDTGTVSNFYWGDEITATLKSIQIDQKNPATNKLLTFDLSGNVTAGSELTVSVGQKSANYDVIIPSSSVRTDANGTYVLKMESKNSPLGNRYLARRVPVEVLAVDDTNSAVSADLGYGDYVITSSSAPLKNGQMVRLATSS